MADQDVTDYPRPIHPLHAILLAFPLPLFLGALLSDIAYDATYQVQWTNFASWLIAGALLVGGLALLWAMPAGLWLSLAATLLALVASWIGYSGLRAGGVSHAK